MQVRASADLTVSAATSRVDRGGSAEAFDDGGVGPPAPDVSRSYESVSIRQIRRYA